MFHSYWCIGKDTEVTLDDKHCVEQLVPTACFLENQIERRLI